MDVGELRRAAETAVDVGLFVSLMLPAVAAGLCLAIASDKVRAGTVFVTALVAPGR